MKKVHICLFIISLLTPVYWTTAQELLEEIEEVVVDTLKKKERNAFLTNIKKPTYALKRIVCVHAQHASRYYQQHTNNGEDALP